MTKEEIALQLTLKAMETGHIMKETGNGPSDATRKNAVAVGDFFKAMCGVQVDETLKKYESLCK